MRISFLLFALSVTKAKLGAVGSDLNAFYPTARYISPTQTVKNGTFACYRTNIDIDPMACGRSLINISVDTKYWLYINGKLAVAHGGLKRGPTLSGSYYDHLNLSHVEWLEGKNSIAILALYLGRRTVPPSQSWWNNEHHDSGLHVIIVSGDICGVKLVTNHQWRSIAHPAYSNDITDDLHQNFRFSDPDIVYDARVATTNSLHDWHFKDYNDTWWPGSLEYTSAGKGPWGELVARPIPLFRRSHQKQYLSLKAEVDPHDLDGFQYLGSGDIPGQDIPAHFPAGIHNLSQCKRACLSLSACKALVWTEEGKGCNLKGATSVVMTPNLQRCVYVRAYKKLVGTPPYDSHVTPTISIHDRLVDGIRIDIRTDSYFTDASSKDKANGVGIPNTRSAYITSSNVSNVVYESVGWMAGHKVIYSVDVMAPIDIANLTVGYYESGYDTDLVSPFTCSNEFLNHLWKKAQRTLYVNMRDSWMDCPDRERSQWTFDVAMDVHQAFYALSSTAHALSRKWILELTAWQKISNSSPAFEPDYAPMSIYAPVPGHWVQELPNQSLMSIAYGFLMYWQYQGDIQTMRIMLPAVLRYLLSYKMKSAERRSDTVSPVNKVGKVLIPRTCPGKPHVADQQCAAIWDWCDGESVNCDYGPIDNAWYYWALNSTITIAKAVNATRIDGEIDVDDLTEMTNRAVLIAAGYESQFWDPQCMCYRSEAHRDQKNGTTDCQTKTDPCTLPDDRANALAIVSGLAPRKRWKTIVSRVLDISSSSSVSFASTAMEKFVEEAMFLANEHDAALSRMQQRYGPMVDLNLSTLWEHWEADPETGFPIAGYNHGWSGGGLVLLSQYVAGLKPISPAWKTWQCHPELSSSIKNISVTVDTVYGTINLELILLAKNLTIHIVVPKSTTGWLRLPQSLGAPQTVVCEPKCTSPTLIDRIQTEKGVSLSQGTWKITARY